ncbi:MAG: acyltransferase domain-containing protein, partial [Reinekea sp.]|nr:acyltransferase domain-containing protein [Reinekea sp.]
MSNIAFVFPGQGSQQVGMLNDFAEKFSLVATTFEEASDALGYNMSHLISQGPVEELNKTEKTQPALLTVSVALYRLWLQNGGAQPAMFAGHSL